CAPAQAQQLEAPDPRRRLYHPELRAVAPEFDPCCTAFRTGRCKPHIAAGKLTIGKLRCRYLNAFGLGIYTQKFLRKKAAERFQVTACEVQGLALDEILHRVSGHQVRVVTGNVGGPKIVPVKQHHDAGAKNRALALRRLGITLEAVDNDVSLAVIISLRATGE